EAGTTLIRQGAGIKPNELPRSLLNLISCRKMNSNGSPVVAYTELCRRQEEGSRTAPDGGRGRRLRRHVSEAGGDAGCLAIRRRVQEAQGHVLGYRLPDTRRDHRR